MHQNFQTINSLPQDTFIFCGHEYTKSNLQWAKRILKDEEMEKYQQQISDKDMTIPSSVFLERKVNVFMRTGD